MPFSCQHRSPRLEDESARRELVPYQSPETRFQRLTHLPASCAAPIIPRLALTWMHTTRSIRGRFSQFRGRYDRKIWLSEVLRTVTRSTASPTPCARADPSGDIFQPSKLPDRARSREIPNGRLRPVFGAGRAPCRRPPRPPPGRTSLRLFVVVTSSAAERACSKVSATTTLLALLRHAGGRSACLLTGADRKSPTDDRNDAIDVVDDARSRHRMCQRGDR
jgi:hypothetical protein